MSIPLTYNLHSIRERWRTSVIAVVGIAGTVGVFIAMLSLASGFKSTLVSSGSPRNAVVMRAGATSEMTSALTLDQVHAVESAPGIARTGAKPLLSAEVVVIAPFELKSTNTNAGVQVRGVSAKALDVRDNVRVVAGRFFTTGLREVVIGRNIERTYQGMGLGKTINLGGSAWPVVGIFDAGGTAFDSEIWCDADVLDQAYTRPRNIFQSLTVRLTSPSAFPAFKDALTTDPRLNVQIERETMYYEKESRQLTLLITFLGTVVAAVMGIGAVFGALNTMYSAVSQRSREIATLRAIGFQSTSVVASFVFESVCIAFLGGALGCLCILPLNGFTTATMNLQTFSQVAFSLHVTPPLLATGICFALLMGVLGGLPPALRAARARIVTALREV